MNNKLTKNEIIENIKKTISCDFKYYSNYENELSVVIDCLFDKNIKRLFPLNEENTAVFRERIGINEDMTPKTLEEVSKIFGISRSKCEHMEGKANHRLRKRIIGFKKMMELSDFSFSSDIQKLMFISPSFDSFIENLSDFEHVSKNINDELKDAIEDIYSKSINLPISVDNLDLSIRTENGLIRAGISTVGELILMTRKELNRIRKLGIESQNELIDKVHSLGFKFKDELSEEKESNISLTNTDGLGTVTQRRNDLLSKGKQLTEERDTLLQQESELDSRIANAVQNKGNIQNGVQNGTTKK